MPFTFSIQVTFPDKFAQSLALGDIQRRGALLEPFAEHLFDLGASSVSWGDDVEHQHAQVKTDDERTAIACLTQSKRALNKLDLIEAMHKRDIGLNKARSVIAELCERGVFQEFAVARQKRRSAVFVALIA
jgi:hypothetical protein